MPVTVQNRNSEMVALLGQDFLPLLDRNHFIDCYGHAINTFTSVALLTIDTVRIQSEPSIFSLSGSALTLLMDGLYRIDYRVTLGQQISSAFDNSVLVWLEESTNGGGGWSEIVGSEVVLYIPPTQYATVGAGVYLRVLSGYQYRIRCQPLAGSSTLISLADGQSLQAMCLYSFK